MKSWANYRTVAEWIKELPLLKDCSRICAGCKNVWTQIATGHVHMVEVEKGMKLPCGLSHAFYCDECYNKLKEDAKDN